MAKVSAGWMDTFASLPADKVAADAVIGGVGGMGLNYAANSSTGDSGGYLGSAVGGAALGGVARGTLRKLGANRSERMATEAAEAAAARAERDAIRSANRTDLKTGVIDKSVSMFGKVMDKITSMGAMRGTREATDAQASTVRNMFDHLPGASKNNIRSPERMQSATYKTQMPDSSPGNSFGATTSSPFTGGYAANSRTFNPGVSPGNTFGNKTTSPFAGGSSVNDGTMFPNIQSATSQKYNPLRTQFKPGPKNDGNY